MVLSSDEAQIQMFVDSSMSHAKCLTPNIKQKPQYVTVMLRSLWTVNCLAENTWPNNVNNEHRIGYKKTYRFTKFLRDMIFPLVAVWSPD